MSTVDDFNYEDKVTIELTKIKYQGKPSHWAMSLSDGSYATGPTFYSVWDSAFELVTGDTGDFQSTHNTWVDFDANKTGEVDEETT